MKLSDFRRQYPARPAPQWGLRELEQYRPEDLPAGDWEPDWPARLWRGVRFALLIDAVILIVGRLVWLHQTGGL